MRCYEMVGEGEIPSIRLSERRIRIPREALDAWLAKRMQGGAS
jgi:excisionase family DNA binding protein